MRKRNPFLKLFKEMYECRISQFKADREQSILSFARAADEQVNAFCDRMFQTLDEEYYAFSLKLSTEEYDRIAATAMSSENKTLANQAAFISLTQRGKTYDGSALEKITSKGFMEGGLSSRTLRIGDDQIDLELTNLWTILRTKPRVSCKCSFREKANGERPGISFNALRPVPVMQYIFGDS